MIRSPLELKKIAQRALKACPAKEVEVWATSSQESHLRFADNGATTSGTVGRTSIRVVAAFGQQSGSASTEDVTSEGIARVARQAADLAKLVPPSPERQPQVKPQKYPATYAWDPAAAKRGPADRAGMAGAALAVAKEVDLVAAGFVSDHEDLTVFLNGAGAYGSTRTSMSDFSTTMRSRDGARSGWAGGAHVRGSQIDAAALARRAAEKADRWKAPIALEPGRYTAVLEPAAVSPLLGNLLWNLDRRAADEGRSAFSKPGGTRIGEPLFSAKLDLVCDPSDKGIPGSPFGEDGLAARKLVAIDGGTLSNLVTSRYWAKEKKLSPTPLSGNWNLTSKKAEEDLDALIAGTERGILVTRIWYVRMLAPQTLTVTGLTRDATFLIEDGKVTSPIKNFRINQSVIEMLGEKNVSAVGPSELVNGRGVPSLRVENLGFASISEAV